MKRKIKNMDKLLLFLMIFYTILGLIMIFSASSITAVLQYGKNESYFFIRQLIYVIFAYFIGLFILFIPNRLFKSLGKIKSLIMISSLMILFITLFAGNTTNGATSWLKIGPISIQPSEFVKTLTIIYLAFSFNKLNTMNTYYKFLMPFVPCIICCFLIALQPDLGTALILAITCFLIFMSLPLKNNDYKKLKIIAGVCAIFVGFLFFFGSNFLEKALTKEQYSRLTFSNPCSRYTEKTGYQVCNGYIAINNGGLFGLGLGNSKQKYLYLPEAYTDFIFPIIVEELGSIFGAVIILGFVIMLYRILKIAKQSSNLSNSILAYGTLSLIVTHLLVNLLGVMAIIPLTGVPLPFLSNGGSFAINIIILMFIVLRVSIDNKEENLKNEINRL